MAEEYARANTERFSTTGCTLTTCSRSTIVINPRFGLSKMLCAFLLHSKFEYNYEVRLQNQPANLKPKRFRVHYVKNPLAPVLNLKFVVNEFKPLKRSVVIQKMKGPQFHTLKPTNNYFYNVPLRFYETSCLVELDGLSSVEA